MASVCVNNVGFTPTKFSSYAWLSPTPRVSFTRDDDAKSSKAKQTTHAAAEVPDLEIDSTSDFEFRLDDPVAMLPADELISDGKLMTMTHLPFKSGKDGLPETVKVSESGTHLLSPKAPRCTTRWKEIFGLKSSLASTNKSLKNFIQRNSKSSSDTGGLSLPLLRESDSMSSRLSLSSSSSGHELEDFPRLSLDGEKQSMNPISLLKSVANNNPNPPSRVRLVKPRPAENAASGSMRRTATEPAAYGVSIDSPRMNPSGKIMFQSLERSSSSPSSGMERSYSANVRVAPVLNVPVCSLSKSGSVLGFGQLFYSHQRKDSTNNNGGSSRSYQCIENRRRNGTYRN